MSADYLQVRGRLVHFHLLHDDDGVYLVDAGLLGAVRRLEAALAGLGRTFADIRAVLLTHGHLDHTRNVAEIRLRSDCEVAAPAADRDHVEGRHAYRGASRACGFSESVGRRLLRYRAPQVDRWFQPGDRFDVWGGLEAVALPGHTRGHCGFLSRRHGLLFAGDLFSNFRSGPRVPPAFLNVDTAEARRSVLDAAALARDAGIPKVALSHCRDATGEQHLAALHRLAARESNT